PAKGEGLNSWRERIRLEQGTKQQTLKETNQALCPNTWLQHQPTWLPFSCIGRVDEGHYASPPAV
ncbi:unnamed protein product, partial [Ectocarpus sp. 13 AM-2016]